MKKKKILNIFVTMFIASNLMTNFTYANPINSETEITNLDETDETDEHDTSDMPDSNDGFNDGSDDIHYDGNEDYSFLNETEDTNKIEELGIIKKDILFENTFYYNEQDKKYYTSNLNEKNKKLFNIKKYRLRQSCFFKN